MKKRRNRTVKHRPGTLERREMKRKVRASPEWADLRKAVYERQSGIDPITMRPLVKGFALHHLSQDDTKYDNLNPDRFVALNHQTHDVAHFLYNIYKREKSFEFLEEYKQLITRMYDLTNSDLNN